MSQPRADRTALRRVLISNRGEIAIRIARAATGLGIESVAVYPAADVNALHTRFATTAVEMPSPGGDPVAAYLDAEQLLAVAREHGCDCLHPGYGFLAESSALAERCAAEGITFVGPPSSALRLFGDKVKARAFAESLGVPVVPGSSEPL